MHQYHISNAIFLLNGFPKKRDVCEKIMFRAWVGAPLKATLSQEPPCLHALPNHYLSIPRHLDLALMLAPHVRCTYESHLTSAGGFSSTTGTSPPPPTASTEPSSARSRWDLRLIFLQNLFCFWSRCTLGNMTRRMGKRSRWTARPTKSTTLSFILILGEGLPCKHSCKYGSSWFKIAHEWISWSSNNVKKAWKREEGPSCSPSSSGPWPSLLSNTTLAATTVDKHHLSNHLCQLTRHHTHHPGNRLSRQTPLQPLCAPQLTVCQHELFMLRNTLQNLPINLKLKKLNGSLNIPCRVCFYLCMRTLCHWGGFLCRPIQHSLLSPHHELPFYIFSCEFSEYSSGETDTNTGCIYYSVPSTMRGVSRDFDFADSRNKEAQLQWNTIDF